MDRILLVEDEQSIRDTVKLNLELEGYEVVTASTGKKALKAIKEQHFDLNHPRRDASGGGRLPDCRTNPPHQHSRAHHHGDGQGRRTGPHSGPQEGRRTITSRSPSNSRSSSFRVEKLITRTKAEQGEGVDNITFGKNHVDFQTYEAETPRGKINLTKKEAMLLKLLVDRKNEVVSRQQILQAVWGYDVYPSTRTIDNFILSFRKYFEENPKDPQFFQSIRGVGYKFVAEDARTASEAVLG